LEPAQPIEVTPTPAAVIEPETEVEITEELIAAETTDVIEPVAESELPDWLRTMRPTEEAVVETPEAEIPEWLRTMRPAEESPTAGLAALVEEEPPVEAPEIEEPTMSAAEAAVALGLLAAVAKEPPSETGAEEEEPSAEDLLAELAALEQSAAAAGVLLPEQPAIPGQTSALLSLDWWIQTASDTGEPSLVDLPEPYLSPRARAAEKEKAAAALAPTVEAKPGERKLPQTGPLRQTGPLSLPQTSPLGTPEPAAVSAEVETLLSRVYQDEHDYAARLDLARTYWATGNREGAYAEYLALVTAGEYTKETMADLETIVEVHDQTDWHRMLGDVYMKAGRLSSALDHYRRALNEV
jgi:tetratricopeptide (TPR) repeat protein